MNKRAVRSRLKKILIPETKSKNTLEAITIALNFLRDKGVKKVFGISSPGHGARCISNSAWVQWKWRVEANKKDMQVWSGYCDTCWKDGYFPVVFEWGSDDKGTGAPGVLGIFFKLSLRGKRFFLFFARILLKVLKIF